MSKATIPHFKARVRESEIAAVVKALRSGHLSQGPEVEALEEEMSAWFDDGHAVAVSSGTAGLLLALLALGVSDGASVVIPSYTCNSLYAAVAYARCRAVCADSGRGSVNITADSARSALSVADAAIVPHTFGFLADIEALSQLRRPVIEDCTHAIGAAYPDGTRAGTHGDVTVLSFHATKLVGSSGGGACVSSSAQIADAIRRLRDCDERPPDRWAFNFKMSDLAAALARARLGMLGEELRKREAMSAAYDEVFAAWAYHRRSAEPQAARFRYLVAPSRGADDFIQRARQLGVQCRRPIYRPIHMQLGDTCPRAEDLHARLVSLPFHTGLSDQEIARVRALAFLC